MHERVKDTMYARGSDTEIEHEYIRHPELWMKSCPLGASKGHCQMIGRAAV